MHQPQPFEIAFLTSFSDTCFRAIPAVAQMCDDLAVRLTIVHAHDPRRRPTEAAAARLRSFFPEADRYAGSRRRLVVGTPAEALAQLRQQQAVDLLVAPAGDPLGLPRLFRHSVRATLLGSGVPALWTVGPETSPAALGRPVRHVACCLEVGLPGEGHLRLACAYASALGATLHLVHVLPEVHDGTMVRLAHARPLDQAATIARLRRVPGAGGLVPQVHVTSRQRLAETLDAACAADVVFVDGDAWVHRRGFARRMRRTIDTLRRPVVCAGPSAATAQWPLVRRQTRRTREWPVLAVARRVDEAETSLAG